MSNPLFNAMQGMSRNLPGQMGQFQQMAQEFKRFKSEFRGDPQQEVQRLLNSGKMTQQQFNQLYGIAHQFKSLFEGL